MKNQLLEKAIIALCIIGIVFRRCLNDEDQILYLMLVVNGIALWLTLLLIFVKALDIKKKILTKGEKEVQNDCGYCKLHKAYTINTWISFFVIAGFLFCNREISDYITIITLGITLTDDVWGTLLSCIFN